MKRWLALISVAVLLLFPVALRLPWLQSAVAYYLSPLGGFVDSYVNFAALALGSVAAIWGAIWVSRREKRTQDKHELRQSALIAFYDITLTLEDLLPAYQTVINDFDDRLSETTGDALKTTFLKRVPGQLYLDDEWVRNIANLSTSLSSRAIKELYTVYGNLANINKIFLGEVTDDEAARRIIIECERYYSRKWNSTSWDVAIDFLEGVEELKGLAYPNHLE